MTSRFSRLSILFLFLAAAIASAQTVTVTSSHLRAADGTLLNGTISFTPANPFNLAGQVVSAPVFATVTNGAFTITLADASQGNPANTCYMAKLTNSAGAIVAATGYSCVQINSSWCTAGVCSFDSYVPLPSAIPQVVTVSPFPMGTPNQVVATSPSGSGTGSVGVRPLVPADLPALPYQAPLGYTPLNPTNNLSDVGSAAMARGNLGLGTAAATNSTAYDAAGSATAAQAAAIAASEAYSANAANLSSGVIAAARLPPIGTNENVSFSGTPSFSLSTFSSYLALTGNVTTFTMNAGVDGQQKVLTFKQGSSAFLVSPPTNVHGFFLVGTTPNTYSTQSFTYYATPGIWLANGPGLTNQ